MNHAEEGGGTAVWLSRASVNRLDNYMCGGRFQPGFIFHSGQFSIRICENLFELKFDRYFS